ncbi:ABC transporter ATP-binding protein [Ruegeria arenilitoris]|uniref:ABC transporter ATP-binding protein n=1 Tax=Ruegeria arenilitoris TaxID=1173585 RepID=UPI0014813BAD|nr:ABC transporter ATP-binding protein [Ruegeria arenilitoris]
MSFLTVRNLTASYGVSQALFGVDLTVAKGEVTALLGRNGMGKSTTVKSICQMIRSKGTITLDGLNLQNLPSYKVSREGVGLVPEGRRCFSDLTVRENLIATARPGEWDLNEVTKLFPRLDERKGQRAGSLSGGEQQMLAIGRALMTNPRLLILDEATEGLAPIIRQEIWAAIRQLKQETSVAILLIDKSLKELSAISERAIILERGRTVWSGKMTSLTHEITEKYIGI